MFFVCVVCHMFCLSFCVFAGQLSDFQSYRHSSVCRVFFVCFLLLFFFFFGGGGGLLNGAISLATLKFVECSQSTLITS